MDAIGLIPARGGSKSVPRKNLAMVAGKPLLEWTVESARASRSLRSVTVSTDSSEIEDLATALGADVLRRPSELAADDTPMLDVVLHALAKLDPCDAVVLLQPTSPLRRAEHIDGALRILAETGADSVVSVMHVPHRYHPSALLQLVDDRLVPITEGSVVSRRQDLPHLYARNGPAVLAVRSDVVRQARSLYGSDSRPYRMEPEDSVDIDEPFDLEVAELLLSRRGAWQ